MIGKAGALLAAVAAAIPAHGDGPSPVPARGVAKSVTPPVLKPLRAERATPAQRVMPGLY